MEATLSEVAVWVSGTVCGDGAIRIQGARDLAHARSGDISFLENANNLKQPEKCLASALIVSKGVQSLLPTPFVPVIVVDDPLWAFTELFRRFRGMESSRSPGISPLAFIPSSAKLGVECEIHPFVVIGENATLGDRVTVLPHVTIGRGCQIGDDVVLHPGVVLYPGMALGNRVILHAHVVVGADGFGYRLLEGRHKKVEQLGTVVVEDDVEIGAGTTIDRATFEETRIGRGTKVDNLVQIGHNCKLGEHNMVVAQVGIGGSTSTGDYVVIAGQAGLADHISIGTKVVIGARAGVMRDVPEGIMVLGAPARPEQEFKRMLVYMERLPDLIRQVKKLNQKVGMKEE